MPTYKSTATAMFPNRRDRPMRLKPSWGLQPAVS